MLSLGATAAAAPALAAPAPPPAPIAVVARHHGPVNEFVLCHNRDFLGIIKIGNGKMSFFLNGGFYGLAWMAQVAYTFFRQASAQTATTPKEFRFEI